MTNITYLLGAGASADALPTNKPNRKTGVLYRGFIDIAATIEQQLRSTDNLNRALVNPICHNTGLELVSSLRWLAEESNTLGTVDTFARHLYNLKSPDLLKLKRTLSFYFIYKQLIDKALDKRAAIFLTKIIKPGPAFRENVKIISWNYDFQIQLAAKRSMKEYRAGNNTHKSLIQYYPSLFYGPEEDATENYSLVHMNGIAGHFYKSDSLKLNPLINDEIKDLNSLLLWLQNEWSNDHIMTFAFEKNPNEKNDAIGMGIKNDSIQIAKHIAEQTDILVIIGYSFSQDNWEVDKQYLDILIGLGRLERIYIQDPLGHNEDILDKLSIPTNSGIDVQFRTDCENYLIPKEFSE